MGAAEGRILPRHGYNFLPGHNAVFLHGVHHVDQPFLTRLADADAVVDDPFIGIKEVSEQVNGPVLVPGRDFDSGNKPNTRRSNGCFGFAISANGVVIGQPKDLNTHAGSLRHELAGCLRAIGVQGVRVEIDHCPRLWLF